MLKKEVLHNKKINKKIRDKNVTVYFSVLSNWELRILDEYFLTFFLAPSCIPLIFFFKQHIILRILTTSHCSQWNVSNISLSIPFSLVILDSIQVVIDDHVWLIEWLFYSGKIKLFITVLFINSFKVIWITIIRDTQWTKASVLNICFIYNLCWYFHKTWTV